MEIPDNLEKYLPYFDAVLLENHGALTWSTDLNAAYMKMESVELDVYKRQFYKSASETARWTDGKTKNWTARIKAHTRTLNQSWVPDVYKRQYVVCKITKR